MPGEIRRKLNSIGCLAAIVASYVVAQAGLYKFTTWNLGVLERQYGVEWTLQKVEQDLTNSHNPMHWFFVPGSRQAMWDYKNQHKLEPSTPQK